MDSTGKRTDCVVISPHHHCQRKRLPAAAVPGGQGSIKPCAWSSYNAQSVHQTVNGFKLLIPPAHNEAILIQPYYKPADQTQPPMLLDTGPFSIV